MEKDAYQLVMLVAVLFGIVSFAAFFYLIDYASRLLRPISILAHVGGVGLSVIESVYPLRLADSPETAQEPVNDLGDPSLTISSVKDGAILACDIPGLASLARDDNQPVATPSTRSAWSLPACGQTTR